VSATGRVILALLDDLAAAENDHRSCTDLMVKANGLLVAVEAQRDAAEAKAGALEKELAEAVRLLGRAAWMVVFHLLGMVNGQVDALHERVVNLELRLLSIRTAPTEGEK
jgi:hypothetical protein